MPSPRRLLPLLALLPAFAAGLLLRPGPAEIGIVEVQRAVLGAPQYQRRIDEVRKWRSETAAELKSASDDFNDRMAQLDQLDETSEAFAELADELDYLRFRLERRKERLDLEFEERQAQALSSTLRDILRVAERVRKARGLDLILQVRDDPIEGRTREEVSSRFVTLNVLAMSESLDITGEVVELLRAEE